MMTCPDCGHPIHIVGVAQLAELCDVSAQHMSNMTSRKGFPEPAGNLGARRDFWVLETVRPYLIEIGLLKEGEPV